MRIQRPTYWLLHQSVWQTYLGGWKLFPLEIVISSESLVEQPIWNSRPKNKQHTSKLRNIARCSWLIYLFQKSNRILEINKSTCHQHPKKKVKSGMCFFRNHVGSRFVMRHVDPAALSIRFLPGCASCTPKSQPENSREKKNWNLGPVF